MDTPPLGNFGDYPLTNIVTPHPHDVLCGRGGGTNNHIGNNHWRALVAANKQLYVTLPKRQKMLLSKSIVNAVRSQNPPGRFLNKDGQSDKWYDVGDQKATEKTSQALREGAPAVRKSSLNKGDEEGTEAASTADSTKSSSTAKKPPTVTNPYASRGGPRLVPPYPPPQNGGPPPPSVPSARMADQHLPPPPPPPVSSPGMIYSPGQIMAMNMYANGMMQGGMSPGMMQYNQAMSPFPPVIQSPNGVPVSGRKRFAKTTKQEKEESSTSEKEQKQSQPASGPPNNPTMPPPPPPGAGFDFEGMASMVQRPLEPTGISFGSISMTSAEHSRLQPTGTSFGSVGPMTGRVLPVDGGLEPAGLSYGSQFSQISMDTVAENYLAQSLLEPDPIREKSNGVPAYQVTTSLEQKKSSANLLECSDTESEDEECVDESKKAEDWKKMQEQLQQKLKSDEQKKAPPKITVPPPPGDSSSAEPDLNREVSAMSAMSFMSLEPISANDRNVSLAVAQLAGCNPTDLKQDISIAFSEMSLSRDVSRDMAFQSGERQQQQQQQHSESLDDAVPPLPLMQTTSKDGDLSEEEKLQMMYLTRGGSLVFDNFGKNKQGSA